jgi:HAD superfamily hydrolase (TIGR01509 family)
MIRGVIFDMDGVITDNNHYHQLAWAEFCHNYDIHLTEEEIHQHIFGRVARDTLEYVFKKELSADEINFYVSQKEEIYREIYKPHIKPVNGLLELLHSLKSNGFRLALATSAPPGNVEFTFSHIPARSFFELILDAESIQKGKPDPEIYLKVIGMLELTPSECIIFEDSIPGIKAALAAGALVIGLATTHKAEALKGVARTIRDFTEIQPDDLNTIRNKLL